MRLKFVDSKWYEFQGTLRSEGRAEILTILFANNLKYKTLNAILQFCMLEKPAIDFEFSEDESGYYIVNDVKYNFTTQSMEVEVIRLEVDLLP